MKSPVRHLYVHIPFCPKVCPYCSFYKEASDRHKTQRFLDAVLLELELHSSKCQLQPETIFFGGGTPSALTTSQLDYLLSGLRTRVDLSALREWTLEMNPATVSLEKAELLLSLGVNRVSMGVQSWDPALLKVLGRVHSGAQAERSFEILREAGFLNLNMDLIFAVPGQSNSQWRTTLKKTIALAPEHISAYCLTYEEDTEFFRLLHIGAHRESEETGAVFFEETMDLLGDAGYEQYEISNYSRANHECCHNLAYWLGHDYLGVGPSAFSTVGGRRWQNVPDTASYCDGILAHGAAESFSEPLSAETLAYERLAFTLRTNQGILLTELGAGEAALRQYASDGFARIENDRVFLTRRGKLVADELAEAFIP